MTKSLKVFGSAALILTALFVLLTFTGQASAKTDGKTDAASKHIKGELVVSIEANTNKMSIQSADQTISKSAKLEQNGFQIADSLLKSIQSDSPTQWTTLSKNKLLNKWEWFT
ncbi:hypothetical protein JNUCC1_00820 [Lentibacillus sp. JNUCC-1]|uniref:hypothetical protein n=1 Tax=Lentibacillus sp. JNUCC-1 TaxID=2654513 RepID=UPI0012E96E77|nr:hypothetical protein [Lentibacillus sp. JNUCC-1]MUV37014.1 hypothetical protein [Lentibacillus sp. JNUCC-1]